MSAPESNAPLETPIDAPMSTPESNAPDVVPISQPVDIPSAAPSSTPSATVPTQQPISPPAESPSIPPEQSPMTNTPATKKRSNLAVGLSWLLDIRSLFLSQLNSTVTSVDVSILNFTALPALSAANPLPAPWLDASNASTMYPRVYFACSSVDAPCDSLLCRFPAANASYEVEVMPEIQFSAHLFPIVNNFLDPLQIACTCLFHLYVLFQRLTF
jgi:hypothetical protein